MSSLYEKSSRGSGGRGTKARIFRRVHRYALPVVALAAVSTLAGFEVARFRGGAAGNFVEAASLTERTPLAVASGDPSVNTFSRLAPQEQAEQLLQEAIARDA